MQICLSKEKSHCIPLEFVFSLVGALLLSAETAHTTWLLGDNPSDLIKTEIQCCQPWQNYGFQTRVTEVTEIN